MKIKVRYWIGVAVAVFGMLPPTHVSAAQPPAQPASSLARPTPQQVAWQDLEMGMFIHLAPQTWQDNEQDHIVIMENITAGERVRSYVVEGMVNGTWQQLTAGSAIGHKKIDRIAPVAATRVRLRIPDAVGTPEIKRFAVYGAK